MPFLYWLESIRTPFGDTFMSLVTHFGEETLFLVIALVMFWCVDKRRGYYLLLVGFAGTVINQWLKIACRIPRPWVLDPDFTIVESARAEATGYSFPSGHTQSVAGTFGSIARTSRRRWVWIACVVIILLTVLSRMYLGVHTPKDVGVSLVIAGVLVFALHPFIISDHDAPRRMLMVIVCMLVLTLAYLLYVSFAPMPADVDPENYDHALKNAYKLLGCLIGLCIVYPIDTFRVKFKTEATFPIQCLKLVLGLMAVLAVKEGLKPLFSLLFGDANFTSALRYMLVVLMAGWWYPLLFPWLNRLSRR